MATLHPKYIYNQCLQILGILCKRLKSIHLLFGVQRWSNRNPYFFQTWDCKIWIHLSNKRMLFISQELNPSQEQVDSTYTFKAVFLAKCSKHGSMYVKLLQLWMVIEKLNKVNFWERFKRIKVSSELNLHVKMFHFTPTFKNSAYCTPTPLNTSQGESLQWNKLIKIHHVYSSYQIGRIKIHT